MQRLASMGCAIGLIASLGPVTASAQSSGEIEKQLAHVATVSEAGDYYCRVSPRSAGTSQTQMSLDFTVSGPGPVEAKMVVTGLVAGMRYSARLSWRGTASASADDEDVAEIILDEVYHFDPDPLPGDAKWSDPSGDRITLRVEDYSARGPEPYILAGTQKTEFGVNDMRCRERVRTRAQSNF